MNYRPQNYRYLLPSKPIYKETPHDLGIVSRKGPLQLDHINHICIINGSYRSRFLVPPTLRNCHHRSWSHWCWPLCPGRGQNGSPSGCSRCRIHPIGDHPRSARQSVLWEKSGLVNCGVGRSAQGQVGDKHMMQSANSMPPPHLPSGSCSAVLSCSGGWELLAPKKEKEKDREEQWKRLNNKCDSWKKCLYTQF